MAILWTKEGMNAKALSSSSKPIIIKRGNVSVRILQGTQTVNGTEYPQYTLIYYSGATRIRKRFGDLEEAKKEGELAATKMANGEHEALKLNGADRANYVQAVDMLKPFNRALNLAVSEYVEALNLLPSGVTLKDAVSDYARRQSSVRAGRTVSDLVTDYLAAKEQAGRSTAHLNDLRGRLTRFGKAFQMPVAQATGALIQSYIDALTVGNRSKLNELRHIIALIRFAVRRKHAPRDLLDELEGVERPEVRPTETLVFTPAELQEILSALRPELVPWLSVAAFCGLRTAEVLRLDWKEVNLERRFVEIKALNAKTASRRLVPLCDAAIAWLKPHAQNEGRLAYYSEENKFYSAILSDVNRARKLAGNETAFEWKRNGLRHSFCSYRLAVTHDAAKTALEAGNSPTMIFRHYRELVTEEEGKAWFAVQPPAPAANVLPMAAGAA